MEKWKYKQNWGNRIVHANNAIAYAFPGIAFVCVCICVSSTLQQYWIDMKLFGCKVLYVQIYAWKWNMKLIITFFQKKITFNSNVFFIFDFYCVALFPAVDSMKYMAECKWKMCAFSFDRWVIFQPLMIFRSILIILEFETLIEIHVFFFAAAVI